VRDVLGVKEIQHIAEIESLISPSESNWEKPIPRSCAQSSIAVTIAADELSSAKSPARGEMRETCVDASVQRSEPEAVRVGETH